MAAKQKCSAPVSRFPKTGKLQFLLRYLPVFSPCFLSYLYAGTLADTVFSEYLVIDFNQNPNTHETIS